MNTKITDDDMNFIHEGVNKLEVSFSFIHIECWLYILILNSKFIMWNNLYFVIIHLSTAYTFRAQIQCLYVIDKIKVD